MEISSNAETNRHMTHSQVESDSDLDDFDVLEKETFESISQSQSQSHSQPSSSTTIVDDDIVNSLAAASFSEPNITTEQEIEGSEISQTVSTISVGSDDVSFDLRRVITENQILKNEVETLTAKLREVGSHFESLGQKIIQSREDRKKFEECSVSLEQLTVENESLKTQIELAKAQVANLEKDLQAACNDLKVQAKVKNETDSIRMEFVQNQFRIKDEQLEQLKKQLTEVEELYQLEQHQTFDLKEKLRAVESRPITSPVNSQLFSFSTEDVAKLHQDLDDCKAIVVRQNTDTMQKDEQIQIMRAQLESSQLALDEKHKMLESKDRDHHSYMTQLMQGKQDELFKMNKMLTDQESVCHQLNTELSQKGIMVATLSDQLKEKDGALRESNLAREKVEDICGKYQSKIKELNSELREVKLLLEAQLQLGEDHHLRALRDEVRQFKLATHELDRENTTLKTQIAALTTENDSISHWKAQCETYHVDYLQVLSQRDALDIQIAELNKAVEDLREQEKKKQDELEELHTTHIRFAQEHINSQEERSNASTSTNGRGIDGTEGGGKNGDIVSQVFNKFKRGVSLLWDGENEPVSASKHSSLGSVSNQSPTAPPSTDPEPSSSSGGGAASGLPPCPVCGKIFHDYTSLVEHCENCGENMNIPVHMDPFVFVPHQ